MDLIKPSVLTAEIHWHFSVTSLYVHIPYCHKKCPYCAFVKELWTEEGEKRMVDALVSEIKAYGKHFPKLEIKTVFLGGGTPSSLTSEGLNTLLDAVYTHFSLSKDSEKTIEMNPESVSASKLSVLKTFHFNRISLGVQSFDENELAFLGRLHTPGRIATVVDMIKTHGFYNFNLDFIFGLPNASLSILEDTLTKAVSLAPTHLSTYALSIERGTPFSKQKKTKTTQETELKHYQFIRKFLAQHGYKHYEVSAFSKPGFKCQHNLAYWHLTPFIGIGPSASSFFQNIHYKQTSSLEAYIENSSPPLLTKNLRPMSQNAMIKDYIVANLRRLEGISFREFSSRFSLDFKKTYANTLEKLYQLKLVSVTTTRVKVTTKGLYLLDMVLEAFI